MSTKVKMSLLMTSRSMKAITETLRLWGIKTITSSFSHPKQHHSGGKNGFRFSCMFLIRLENPYISSAASSLLWRICILYLSFGYYIWRRGWLRKRNQPEIVTSRRAVRLMKSITSKNLISRLTEWFSRYGYPRMIVSDNGAQFTSGEFQQFVTNKCIKHVCVTPWHPKSNGMAERVIRTLKRPTYSIEPTISTHINHENPMEAVTWPVRSSRQALT
ncbi:unnamed protein product, partial [Nesidiocoris tenuis]